MTVAVSKNGNPFPGLRSFEREQAHLFFGRDEQIRDLIARLKQHRFLPIVGVSGSGKSSLVRAGLIPALTGSYVDTKTSGWRIAALRPGRKPVHELVATLCRELAIAEPIHVLRMLRGSTAGLARVAQKHLDPNEKLLVLVDQFEELFRYGDEADANETNDATAFVKLLLAAAGESEHPLPGLDNLPIYVVTTMRSDFLGRCSRFVGLPEALNQSQYLIPRLTREQQRDVIEGPVGMAGASIEPALVQRLVNDLGDNPDQLPALQHALMRTWDQSDVARAQGKPITVADYEAVGGMADALNRDADEVFASLSTNIVTERITRRLFQRLVQPGAPEGETRSPTPLSELVAITAADEANLNRIITVFQERGFLTTSHDLDPIIDITHESLIRGWRQLTKWVQEEVRSAAIYLRLVDQATQYARNKASLYIDPQLQLTLNWRHETKPNKAWAARYDSRFEQAMEFLEHSRKEYHAALDRAEQQRLSELKRARLTALVLATLLILTIGASIFAIIQWQKIRAERDRSSRLLYDSNIYFASSAVASGQSALARDRLTEVLDAELKELRGFEWFYLWRAVHADEVTLSGHSDVVNSVAFSLDGKTLASASNDNTVKLWDIARRVEIATLSGHSNSVNSVAFSLDGKTLASGSEDKTVKLWDTATKSELMTLLGHSGPVWSVVFSPDGRTLASVSTDKTVKLWDIADGKEVAVFNYSSFVRSVAFAPDGRTLASAGDDRSVKLWDIATRREVATFSGHSRLIMSTVFSPDGKILASASLDKTVKLWDIATRKEVATLSGHSGVVLSVVFSPDGKTLASASIDNTVKLWDGVAGKEIATLSGHSSLVRSIAFSPDGRTLASASHDKTVKLWDTVERREMTTLARHSAPINSVAFSPDGKSLASVSADQTVRLWDIALRKEIANLSGDFGYSGSVAFSPNGRTVAFASLANTVKLWDSYTRREVASLSGHSGSVNSAAFSPDGNILASASEDNTVRLWNLARPTEITTLSRHSAPINSVVFSPDGKTLAYASDDFTVRLWDFTKQKEVFLLGHSAVVLSVVFSPDGKTLASASYDKTVKLWDVNTRKQVGTLSGHSGSVNSVAFSPDGKTLASASNDNTVKLWDMASHKEVATLSGHSNSVNSIAFSPDGKTLASAGADNTVRLWFAASEQEVEERRRRGY